MIEKHFKKAVLLLMILALGYWAFISRYTYVKSEKKYLGAKLEEVPLYFDRWTQKVVERPTPQQSFYYKKEEQKTIKRWGVHPQYLDTLTAYREWNKSWMAYKDTLEMLTGLTIETRVSIWRRKVEIGWENFKKRHPEIPQNTSAWDES